MIAFETEGTVSVVIHTPINTTHIKGTPLSTVKRTNYSMIKMAACLSCLRGEPFCDEWDLLTDPPFRFFFRAQQSSAYSRKIFIPSVLIFFKVLPCFFSLVHVCNCVVGIFDVVSFFLLNNLFL